MATIALLSNPSAFGSADSLPQLRSYCAERADIFHYEVEHLDGVAAALKTISEVGPKILVINGGDGTVQAALTEIYHGQIFGENSPPIAVLANGRTNMIAHDLGASGDPLVALRRITEMAAKDDFADHVVRRELIALSDGRVDGKLAIGMFLGAADLTEFIIYCRSKIYPLGLSSGLSHLITAFAAMGSLFFGLKSRYLPRGGRSVRVFLVRKGEIQGRFALMMVTTLEKLLFRARSVKGSQGSGRLRFMAIEQKTGAMLRFLYAHFMGLLGKRPMPGIHIEQGDIIRIEGDKSEVVLDGEFFETAADRPITLQSTEPMPFLKLAA